MTAATLAIGYGDGYSRALSNRGFVLLRGRRARVVGRVSMDYITVDATGFEGLELGEEAVLFGHHGTARLGADEVAGWIDTIAWEVLCAIGRRVPRVYVNA
jgi:alanine racemase